MHLKRMHQVQGAVNEKFGKETIKTQKKSRENSAVYFYM